MSEMKKDELAEDQALIGEEDIGLDDSAAEIEALRAERDELKDRFMRALADASGTDLDTLCATVSANGTEVFGSWT